MFETPVTPAQILGRSLTHAFTVASAYAKQLHGVRKINLHQLFMIIYMFFWYFIKLFFTGGCKRPT